MFRCFHPPAFATRQKKTVMLSSKALKNTSEDCSQNQGLQSHTFQRSSNSSNTILEVGGAKNSADYSTNFCAPEHEWKNEEIKNEYSTGSEILVQNSIGIKKSRSLGSGLDMNGKSGDIVPEDGVDEHFSSDGSHDICGSLVPNVDKDSSASLRDQFQEAALTSDTSLVNSAVVNHEPADIISKDRQLEKQCHVNHDSELSGEGESCGYTPRTPPVIVKSRSLPSICSSGRLSPLPLSHSRSAEEHVLDSKRKETLRNEVKIQALHNHENSDLVCNGDSRNNRENPTDYSCDDCNYGGSARDWLIPAGVEVSTCDSLARDASSIYSEELSNQDFTKKRIEEWVIDLQLCSDLKTSSDLPTPHTHEAAKHGNSLDVSIAWREEGKIDLPGMEAVKKYISSLPASTSTAQLVNQGLVMIPFLSPFSSLRALNLSGNAIVRITAGALPRGLHVLNLSKNSISTIEGLRELMRLRVLDLSYNRLLRIGHGLASCSSLKELYLAGNKISVVEGLHRLLKLNVLDLRFNKISTTKCLGQLASNYLSLQVISLEGNPAQKNVGDEQLKKYLQGLLPRLTYFNRRPIKVGTLKDGAERSARLGIGAHPADRGLKAELKNIRKGTSSSAHGRRSQATASSKPSSSKHLRMPPSGTKLGIHQNLHEFTNKLLSLRSDLSMRKSRSLGNLGDL